MYRASLFLPRAFDSADLGFPVIRDGKRLAHLFSRHRVVDLLLFFKYVLLHIPGYGWCSQDVARAFLVPRSHVSHGVCPQRRSGSCDLDV